MLYMLEIIFFSFLFLPCLVFVFRKSWQQLLHQLILVGVSDEVWGVENEKKLTQACRM